MSRHARKKTSSLAPQWTMVVEVDQIQKVNTRIQSLQLINTMKTKILLFIAGAAVVTLSFTFATTSRVDEKKAAQPVENLAAPAGGFALEEK